jgi:hypothetical protein
MVVASQAIVPTASGASVGNRNAFALTRVMAGGVGMCISFGESD